MFRSCLILSLVSASPVLAQADPSFDCTKAESSAETLVCEDAELARLDRLVADRYAAALDRVSSLQSGAAAAKDDLRADQRGWISGRDECWKADDLRACVESAYLRRNANLVARWFLEEPSGVTVWACGENPANEVTVYAFDTELPSVRFERGDSIDTGVLVPTASGVKYEGSFGRSLWSKGSNAMYRDPDPDGTEYSCSLTRQE